MKRGKINERCTQLLRLTELPLTPPELGLRREGSVGQTRSPLPRLAAWLLEANPPLELAARDLNLAQTTLSQLARVLEQLETSSQPDSEVGQLSLMSLSYEIHLYFHNY